jgi:hypothetical protein
VPAPRRGYDDPTTSIGEEVRMYIGAGLLALILLIVLLVILL